MPLHMPPSCRYWFSSPSLTRAVTNDLKMYKDLSTFKRVDKTVSKAALVIFLRHTWYLTEYCISLSIFNIDLEVEDCNKFSKKIGRLPSSHLYIKKPFLPPITPTSKISEFVGPRSVLCFPLLNFDHSFLLAEG